MKKNIALIITVLALALTCQAYNNDWSGRWLLTIDDGGLEYMELNFQENNRVLAGNDFGIWYVERIGSGASLCWKMLKVEFEISRITIACVFDRARNVEVIVIKGNELDCRYLKGEMRKLK